MTPNVLLIQIRRPGDPMGAHERLCVGRRLAGAGAELQFRNALTEPASASWLDDCRAIIIGGSGDISATNPAHDPWVTPLRRLLHAVLTRRHPLFGICFGHQLLGKHLGATLRTEPAHAEAGTTAYEMTAEGIEDPVFRALGPYFDAQTGHSDSLLELPPGTERIAMNARLSQQAIRVKGACIYGTQFHPDMTGAETRERYLAYQEEMAKVSPEIAKNGAEKYRLGADEATALLGRFVQMALQL